jgi:hypothetical protein
MITRSLSALACVLATGAVLAQGASPRPVPPKAVLGKAIEVKGLVTVSDESGVSRVVVNNAVIDRSRFVTSSSGSATLRLDNGCDILLKPNQALTIEHEQPCDALWASIESLGNPSGLLLASGVSPASLRKRRQWHYCTGWRRQHTGRPSRRSWWGRLDPHTSPIQP